MFNIPDERSFTSAEDMEMSVTCGRHGRHDCMLLFSRSVGCFFLVQIYAIEVKWLGGNPSGIMAEALSMD